MQKIKQNRDMDTRFLIIGEVFTDVYLGIKQFGHLERIGGIFHSCRAFSALGVDYSIAYYSPSYLCSSIASFSKKLFATHCYSLGIIEDAPNIMIVGDPTEAGDQQYINPLCKQAKYVPNEKISLKQIIEFENPSDVIVYPGRFDVKSIITELDNYNINIHIDFHYDADNLFDIHTKHLQTAILSTSSSNFIDKFEGNADCVARFFSEMGARQLLLKENRGGSRVVSLVDNITTEGFSFPVNTVHSVGVGDVFNSIFLSSQTGKPTGYSLTLAALISASYACTYSYDSFTQSVKSILDNIDQLSLLRGTRLPWEKRRGLNIYIAGPDFPDVNKTELNSVVDCLNYHNFAVRLPIRENGLITESSSEKERLECFCNDLNMMSECDLLIAVVLTNDPGMYVELGMFVSTGKPAILFNPFGICSNNFALNAPTVVCNSLTEVIDKTFELLGGN